MPPMPSPVRTRQIESTVTLVVCVTIAMPSAMTTRHPRIVRRRPMRSATPPNTTEPTAMPMSSIESTAPSATRSIPHSVAMPGEAKLIDSTSNPSSALRPTMMATAMIWPRDMGASEMISRGSRRLASTEFTAPSLPRLAEERAASYGSVPPLIVSLAYNKRRNQRENRAKDQETCWPARTAPKRGCAKCMGTSRRNGQVGRCSLSGSRRSGPSGSSGKVLAAG